ncbi:MAG: orotate phosphoribosyltransferase [Actinomycetia bacterium]|nr:orotate phosphoribosyltransferase [Actinomycetes bacterium]
MNKSMTDSEILQVFRDTGAIRSGHFQLTSGRHSDTYFQCARVLEQPRLTRRLAQELASRLPSGLAQSIDLVASPAVGGILFGNALADVLDCPMVFSEREGGKMCFRRSFEIELGAKVLVAEDVVTSGGSVKELVDLVVAAGGSVLAVAALVDRGSKPLFSEDFYPLICLDAPSWPPDKCQLCQQGVPLYSPGSRRLAKS